MTQAPPHVRRRGLICLAALAFSAGVAALLCEHDWGSQELIQQTHVLFAVASFTAISAALVAGVGETAGHAAPALYLYTRSVSRRLYASVYGLAFVGLCLHLMPTGRAQSLPLEGFQFYIGCCIAPLWLIRACVLLCSPTPAAELLRYRLSRHPTAERRTR